METQLNFQIVGRLLDHIRERHLTAGDALPPENVLAAELDVSRVILREGLSYLKALGLVSSKRGSGYRVQPGSISLTLSSVLHALARGGLTDLAELYELRRFLELGAICDAVNAATDADREEVRAALAELETMGAVTNDEELQRFNQAELRFHRALTTPARCQILEIINQALNDFFSYRLDKFPEPVRLSTEDVARTNLAHRAIAEAFLLGNAPAAQLLLQNHLQ